MSGERHALPSWTTGLSSRLLVLTIFFVMLSEVLIYVPSIARFRMTYLGAQLDSAFLASLALKATPDYMVSAELEGELLENADVHMIVLKRPEFRTLMLGADMPPTIDATFDMRGADPIGLIVDAFDALLRGDRVIRVVGQVPEGEGFIEVVMDEAPLRDAMFEYSVNILNLSIVISLLTASLVYLSLHILMVRPMRRITESMVAFRKAPEAGSSVIAQSARSDEIGTAQRELATMQGDLRAALKQKTRLAALGSAVSKINHDLRNILATAHLVSDRLSGSDDPEVRRVTPTLIGAIDRAIRLCTQTLNFGRAEESPPNRRAFVLAELIDDVAAHVGLPPDGHVRWRNEVVGEFAVDADREQLFRVLLNLGRNAVEAMQTSGDVRIRAQSDGADVMIEVMDTGPGLPEKSKENLFQPFAGSARAGGIGLGLVIARELVQAHGGDLALAKSDASGTTFRIHLPDAAAAPGQPARQAGRR